MTISATIYRLVDPRDGSTKYVGQTTDCGRRFHEHIQCRGGNPRMNRWIASLRSCGELPEMVAVSRVPIWEAHDAEALEARAAAREGAVLLNGTCGKITKSHLAPAGIISDAGRQLDEARSNITSAMSSLGPYMRKRDQSLLRLSRAVKSIDYVRYKLEDMLAE